MGRILRNADEGSKKMNTQHPTPNTKYQIPNILLVDDEISILKTIGPFLESLGYHVTTAQSGEEAIELLNMSTFDLVITDLIMGDVDGYQVLETGKNLRSETMFIVLTGHSAPTFIINALRLGVDDYLIKPCEPEEMRFRVERCLEKLESKMKAKQAEEALRKSEERYRTFFDNSPISLWEEDYSAVMEYMKDLHDSGVKDMRSYFDDHPEEIAKCAGLAKILDVNPATLQIYEAQSREDLLENLNDVFTEDSLEIFKEQLITFFEGGLEFRGEGITQTLTGKKNYIQLMTSLLSEYRVLVSITDITDVKRMEAQLYQARKMEAIATLAGGVAHEFNNALMGIMGTIELLQMDSSKDERRDRHFAAMKGSGYRMSRLTDRLLAYAQGGKYQPKDLKLDDFVMETLPILQHDLGPEVRVETHFSKVSYIKADPTQMQMLLLAVLTNSNEAMEEGGSIKITAQNKDVDEDFAKENPGLKPGRYVCLAVEDNGMGMDEETRAGIFEPFFTTKFQGRGMGMAAVYGIVKNHDGWIYVDSEPGKGTGVRIYLPTISTGRRERGAEGVKQPEIELNTGEGTILMVEDEEIVIEVTQAMLEMLGYRVMAAKTGKDAVHMAETFDGLIDLVLLDIKLPDIDGRDLYPMLMKARSNFKVIVCSGYSIDGPAREILDAGAQDFIQKPFSMAALSEKIKKVLE